MWLIYKHTNLINGLMYIGQTCQKPEDRWQNGRGYENNLYFNNAIKKEGWNNFSHEIIEENIETQEKANEREIYWISYFHTYIKDPECKGYNLSKGGDNREHLGKPIYQINIQTLEIENIFPTARMAERETNTDHSMIGRCCKKKDRSISANGFYWCYKEDYEKWEKPIKKDKTNSPLGKEVYQIDMNTLEVVSKYKSTKDAERNITIGKSTGISQCCNKKRYSEGGYFWCFVDDWSEDWKPIKNKNLENFKRVYKINKDNINIVKEFESIELAAKDSGIKNSETISRCCKGKQKTAGGFYWCYKEDYENFKNEINRKE